MFTAPKGEISITILLFHCQPVIKTPIEKHHPLPSNGLWKGMDR